MIENLRDSLLQLEWLGPASKALILLVVGLVLASLLSRALGRVLAGRFDLQRTLLLKKLTYYGLLILFAVAGLHQLGFNLSVLLGAAGVLTVAIGFASQTAASNLISGLFLIAEKPFAIGDTIQVGATVGEVLAIDLLSVKLRAFDNRFIRIPNETMLKTEVGTLTKFPIRRVDVQVSVAYKEDLHHVREVLLEVADANLQCLDEPKPLFLLQGFADSGISIQFSVWAAKQNFLALKNAMHLEIKAAFDKAGIEIPFPHRALYAGAATAPLPIAIVPSPSSPGSTLSESEPS